MKFFHEFMGLCLLQSYGWDVTAFSVKPSRATSPTALKATESDSYQQLFPLDTPLHRIEGGETLRTYKLPPHAERVQMVFRTNGRPLKAKIALWLGPLRQTHGMEIDSQDGSLTPFQATLKFKPNCEPTLKVSSASTGEFPLEAGVVVPSVERSKEIGAISQAVWDRSIKTRLQGGAIEGGGGAVRVFLVPPHVQSVQIMFWSKDVGRKSLKARIEVLQGPNNFKQAYDLQCGGGSQPYHAVFQTPGEGCSIRIYNKKFLEDGLFEMAVLPYEIEDEVQLDSESILPVGYNYNAGGMTGVVSKRDWWE